MGSPDARPATLCVLSDMTALKREQDLRLETERRYQRIVETANEGVWVVDPSGMTTLVNDRMAEMLGTTRAEIEGRLDAVKVAVDVSPDLPLILMDPIQMKRVLVNILDNAIEALAYVWSFARRDIPPGAKC